MEKNITRTIRIATGTAICVNLEDQVVKKDFIVTYNRKTIVKDVTAFIESLNENLLCVRIASMNIMDATYEMPISRFMSWATVTDTKEVNSLEA